MVGKKQTSVSLDYKTVAELKTELQKIGVTVITNTDLVNNALRFYCEHLKKQNQKEETR